jgi:hypothetical protein
MNDTAVTFDFTFARLWIALKRIYKKYTPRQIVLHYTKNTKIWGLTRDCF